jgi:hypothetical protein
MIFLSGHQKLNEVEVWIPVQEMSSVKFLQMMINVSLLRIFLLPDSRAFQRRSRAQIACDLLTIDYFCCPCNKANKQQ